jgi:hypothetical protein
MARSSEGANYSKLKNPAQAFATILMIAIFSTAPKRRELQLQ